MFEDTADLFHSLNTVLEISQYEFEDDVPGHQCARSYCFDDMTKNPDVFRCPKESHQDTLSYSGHNILRLNLPLFLACAEVKTATTSCKAK